MNQPQSETDTEFAARGVTSMQLPHWLKLAVSEKIILMLKRRMLVSIEATFYFLGVPVAKDSKFARALALRTSSLIVNQLLFPQHLASKYFYCTTEAKESTSTVTAHDLNEYNTTDLNQTKL